MVVIHFVVIAMVMPCTCVSEPSVPFVSLMKHSVTRLLCTAANLSLELINLLQIVDKKNLEMQGYLMLVLIS